MHNNRPGARWHDDGEEFEHFVERQFVSLHERLGKMESSVAGLTADVDALAKAIPQLATDLSNTHKELAASEQQLTAEIAAREQDDADKARLEGELAQVTAAKEKLDPIVAQVQSLVPAPTGEGAGTAGDGAAAKGDGAAAGPSPTGGAALTKPPYTHTGDPSTIDSVVWLAMGKVTTSGEPLYEFANDVPGGEPTGAQEGVWTPYTGEVKDAPPVQAEQASA